MSNMEFLPHASNLLRARFEILGFISVLIFGLILGLGQKGGQKEDFYGTSKDFNPPQEQTDCTDVCVSGYMELRKNGNLKG